MCWTCCWHKTRRLAKEVAKKHGEFPSEYYKCVEVKCCKCGRMKWEHHILKDLRTGKELYFTEEALADLPLLSEIKEADGNESK